MEFSKSSCANKIEYKKLVETGQITTEMAKKQEDDILPKNNNEQYIYIGIGAVVLITSLYLIIRK
jgi:polyhydroxyalkanoate synthesis regulator phasin